MCVCVLCRREEPVTQQKKDQFVSMLEAANLENAIHMATDIIEIAQS